MESIRNVRYIFRQSQAVSPPIFWDSTSPWAWPPFHKSASDWRHFLTTLSCIGGHAYATYSNNHSVIFSSQALGSRDAGVNILAFLPKIPSGKVCCFGHVWEKFGGKNRIFVLNFGLFALNFGIHVLKFGIFVLNFGIFTLSPAGKVLVFLPEYFPLVCLSDGLPDYKSLPSSKKGPQMWVRNVQLGTCGSTAVCLVWARLVKPVTGQTSNR